MKEEIGQQRWKCDKDMEIDDAGVKVDEIRRFENGNGKAKIGWNLDLHDVMVQTMLKKFDEYKN